MIHLQENKDKLKTLLVQAEYFSSFKEIKKTELFDQILYTCIETNEIQTLRIVKADGQLFFVPTIRGELYNESLYEYIISKENIRRTLSGEEMERIDFTMQKNWKLEDYEELARIAKLNNPKEMMMKVFMVAKRIVQRSSRKLGVVCGPISSGPNSVEENFRIFNRTVFKLSREMDVFTQLPFECVFRNVDGLVKSKYPEFLVEGSSSYFFIEEFYRPIFCLDKQWVPNFIHNWETSIGANEEREIFSMLKIKMRDLPQGYEKDLLS